MTPPGLLESVRRCWLCKDCALHGFTQNDAGGTWRMRAEDEPPRLDRIEPCRQLHARINHSAGGCAGLQVIRFLSAKIARGTLLL